MIKAIVIDDEPLAREQIIHYLKDDSDVTVVEECADGLAGFHAITRHNPDLVFLDIQMPKVNGFEMLELLDEPPVIVFSTAYDEYALKAFEVHAADYLLKPFAFPRFQEALEQARRRIETGNALKQKNEMHQTYREKQPSLNRIVVKKNDKITILPANEVYFLEAMGDYVALHTAKERYLKNGTMKFFEEQLDPSQFIRIHRSYIVNIEYLKHLEAYTKDSWLVWLSNSQKVFASRSGYKKLRQVTDRL